MSGPIQTEELSKSLGIKCLYFLSIVMVLLGLINATPGIPGYDDLVAQITGRDGATFRRFPFEWFYPFFFSLMMIIVAFKHSLWRLLEGSVPTQTPVWIVHGHRAGADGSRDLHNILH
jgi:hypothetical protein